MLWASSREARGPLAAFGTRTAAGGLAPRPMPLPAGLTGVSAGDGKRAAQVS